ncbi:MAG: hypothetical protein IPP17_31185 [Bacteroidetes bacterium]|nr:hypothetical protein [Bacteroidota bacterium]
MAFGFGVAQAIGMEEAKPISILELLRMRQTWLVVGLIFLGRMAYFLYWGTLLEIDSLGYLKLQTALYHPPLYSAFNGLAIQIGRSVDAIVVAQSLLYSLSASLLVRKWITTSRFQLLIAILLALEPCSGKTGVHGDGRNGFSEPADARLVRIADVEVRKLEKIFPRCDLHRICAGTGLPNAVRSSGLCRGSDHLDADATLALATPRLGNGIILLAFQFALLPLRMYYQVRFGTLQTNAFSSLSLWNTSAYLYPDSRIAAAPKTAFERYLICFPAADYALYHTWHTNQMFHDSLAFQRFVKENHLNTAEIQAAATSAGATARKLLWASPIRHLREFVWPNVQRPFSGEDMIHSNLLPDHIEAPLYFHHRHLHFYWSDSWWAIFGLLLASTGLQLRYRRRMPAYAGLLLLSCWLYLAGIAGLAVIFLRFVYLLAPIVVLALGIQLEALWQRKADGSKVVEKLTP